MNQAAKTKRITQAAAANDSPDYKPIIPQPDTKNQNLSIPSRPAQASDEERASREERIRHRAYELYKEGGRQDGNSWGDWFAAELEFQEQENEED